MDRLGVQPMSLKQCELDHQTLPQFRAVRAPGAQIDQA